MRRGLIQVADDELEEAKHAGENLAEEGKRLDE